MENTLMSNISNNNRTRQIMRLIAALFVMLLLSPTSACASDDFGMWGEVQAEKEFNDRWSMEAGVKFRSRDNLKAADRWSFGVAGNYQITPWLEATVGYALLNDHYHKENTKGTIYSDYWSIRHRFNVQLTGSLSWGKFGFSLRERWQYSYRPEKTAQRYETGTDAEVDEKVYGAKGKNVWRNRLQVKWKLNNLFRPYVNAETFVAKELEKIRYNAGTELQLDKHNSLDIKYIYQHICKEGDDEPDRHVIGIGYTHKF